LLAGAAGWCAAASIEGTATDTRGRPLHRVPVCLKLAAAAGECVKLRRTDRQGGYRFKGVREGAGYLVEVFGDRSASGRKSDRYRNYVWEPLRQPALVAEESARIRLPAFIGKFNFSNYQRVITLSAADFPELASLDLQSGYVALKVFVPATREGEPPETVFLGQVSDRSRLSIDASVPLATPALHYDIYSIDVSISGSIALQ
jgi:hypothetical protein